MFKPWTSEIEKGGGGDYQDTVALLQEEIARLEDELRAKDEAMHATNRLELRENNVDYPRAADPNVGLNDRLEEFKAALNSRDETIALLLEQNRLLEEAEEAGRDEWNQLQLWIEEVERRVDGRDETGRDLEERLRGELRSRETFESEIQADRKAWNAWRGAAEQEIAHLRARLADSMKSAANPTALRTLEEENQRLRQDSLDSRALTEAGAEVGPLRARLEAAKAEAAELERRLQIAHDERERERMEYEVELASLRGRIARDAVERQLAPSVGAVPRTELSPDERIRAFREHLRDLHVDESKQKDKRGLPNRLSRLWRRTAPGS